MEIIKVGLLNGIKVLFKLAKVIIPAVIFVAFLQTTGILQTIAKLFAPALHLIGLPGEAAVPFVIGLITSIYGGIGGMIVLSLSSKELTILGTMIAICHGAIVENSVVIQTGVSGKLVFCFRLIGAVIAAVFLNIFL
jgi:hypothetical protein